MKAAGREGRGVGQKGILLRWEGPTNLVWTGWVLAAFGYQVGPGVSSEDAEASGSGFKFQL